MKLAIAFAIGVLAREVWRGIRTYCWLKREQPPLDVTSKERQEMFMRDER